MYLVTSLTKAEDAEAEDSEDSEDSTSSSAKERSLVAAGGVGRGEHPALGSFWG